MITKTFYPFYEERIIAIINRIKKTIYPIEILSNNVWLDLSFILFEIMHRVSVRTLIAEMHECIEKGNIIRSNRKEGYLSFMELLSRIDYREDILACFKNGLI